MPGVNQVIDCNTLGAWEEQLDKGKENKKLLVVDFMISSYGPCQSIFEELAKKNPEVTFLKVDVDKLKIVSKTLGVDAMPTFLFFKEGKVVDKVVGAKKDELQTKVEKHVAAASPTDDTSPTPTSISIATAIAFKSIAATATASPTASTPKT